MADLTVQGFAGGNTSTLYALALVVGVAEPLVRFGLTAKQADAPDLALAVVANVACVGLIVFGLTAAARMVLAAIRVLAGPRRRLFRTLNVLLMALIGVTIVWQSDAIGLAAHWDVPAALSLPAAALICGGIAYRNSRGPTSHESGRRTRMPAIAWLASTGLTVLAACVTRATLPDGPMGPVVSEAKAGARELPNIVLIVLDTFRADRIGAYAGGTLTPNIDRLAESSLIYTNAISTAPRTLPSHASLFTGLYPMDLGVSWGSYRLEDRYPSLAEMLRSRGYRTTGISNNPLVNQANGLARGFDTFFLPSRHPCLRLWRWPLQCGAVGSAAEWLGIPREVARDEGGAWTNRFVKRWFGRRRSTSEPFFLFINYFEPHDPFEPPQDYFERFIPPSQRAAARGLQRAFETLAVREFGTPGTYTPQQVRLLRTLYDAEIAYQDAIAGELFDLMRSTGLLDDSWVILTADHGELFGESDRFGHGATAHHKLLHVPLIIRPPGGIATRTVSSPVQPVDLFVTILEIAGLEPPENVQRAYAVPGLFGHTGKRDLSVAQTHGAGIWHLSNAQRANMQADLTRWLSWIEVVYADGYRLELKSREQPRLFRPEHDPEFTHDLARDAPHVVRSLTERLRRWSGKPQSENTP